MSNKDWSKMYARATITILLCASIFSLLLYIRVGKQTKDILPSTDIIRRRRLRNYSTKYSPNHVELVRAPGVLFDNKERTSQIPRAETEERITYRPGKLDVIENGLVLSEGLTAKIIAEEGEYVRYLNGRNSDVVFHDKPDGGAVFEEPSGNGWVYVSNAEREKGNGGVGAFTFDKDGNVIKFEKILTGTSRNCQGGKTPWNTWISCEENLRRGQCWETDPFNKVPPVVTKLGGDGGNFEAVAIDNRNIFNLKFFVTNDDDRGELRRFSPDPSVLREALQEREYWKILSSPGRLEYLVLHPKDADKTKGTFSWTSDLRTGRRAASKHFQNCEGVDAYDGKLYFVSKKQFDIFELDLDNGTYHRTSTKETAVSGQPDQVKFVRGDKNVLYLSEDGKQINTAGVYGRDINGNSFTVLKSAGEVRGDAGGIAFSPDKLHMYVAFLNEGKIFDVRRTDQQPFNGKTLNIRYHSS